METISYRKYKQIDIDKFKNDIDQSCLYTMTGSTCNEDTSDMETLVAQYNTTLRRIMDEHAPEKTKTVKKKPAMPWFNDKTKGLKRDRNKAERQWLQHRCDPIKKCNMQPPLTRQRRIIFLEKCRNVLEIKRNSSK